MSLNETEITDAPGEPRLRAPAAPVRRALPVPPAPLVGAVLSGFVVGVVLTLLLAGLMGQSGRAAVASPGPLPTATRPDEAQMYAQVRRLVVSKLGPPDTNLRTSRLISLHLLPVDVAGGDGYADARYRTVAIIFRLYDHPLGPAWRVRAAKADVFAVMKALYTSSLPVYDVEMQGKFPLLTGKRYRLETVLEAFMSYQAANGIPWKHWARDQEGRLWNLLPYSYIDPHFS